MKCIHYYACICALASDPKFTQEFIHFTNHELSRNDSEFLKIDSGIDIAKITKSAILNLENRTKLKMDKVTKRGKKYKKLIPNVPVEIKVLNPEKKSEISWKFIDFLSYVTESINQTMQFENYANLNTLIFSIPEVKNSKNCVLFLKKTNFRHFLKSSGQEFRVYTKKQPIITEL